MMGRTLQACVGLIAIFAFSAGVLAGEDEERARRLLEALGGGSPPASSSEPAAETTPADEVEPAAGEETPETPRSFAEGGRLPGDLSDLLEAYEENDGELSEEEVVSASEEVQREAQADSERGRAILQALDTDNDGQLDSGEAQAGVAQARQQRAAAERQAGQLFNEFDQDRDGELSLGEFAALSQRLGLQAAGTETMVRVAFERIDRDSSGGISAAEARLVANQLAAAAEGNRRAGARAVGAAGQQRVSQREHKALVQLTQVAFAQFDRNGDERISRREAQRDDQVAAEFGNADTDQDGYLSGPEVYEFLKVQRAANR